MKNGKNDSSCYSFKNNMILIDIFEIILKIVMNKLITFLLLCFNISIYLYKFVVTNLKFDLVFNMITLKEYIHIVVVLYLSIKELNDTRIHIRIENKTKKYFVVILFIRNLSELI